MLRLPVVLDISYKAIYGLNFQQSFSGFTFAEGYRLSFSELSPEEFGQGLLTTFINRHYPYNTGVYLNLPYEASFVRELVLPFVDKKKVQEVIRYELESLLPFLIDEVIFDYYAYPNLEEGKTRVITVGSDKKNLLPYLEMLRVNNITLLGIYSPLDALFNLYPYTEQDSCVMLHVSSMTSLILIIHDGEWLFSRILPLGYDNLIYSLANKWGKSFEESEKIFIRFPLLDSEPMDSTPLQKQFKISKPQEKLLQQSIEDFGDSLGGEIRLTLRSISNKVYEELKNRLPIVLSSDLHNQTILESLLMKKIDHPIMSFPYARTPIAAMPKEQTINFGAVLSQTSKSLKFLHKNLKQYIVTGKIINKAYFYSAFGAGMFLFILSYFIDFYNNSQAIKVLDQKNKKVYQQYFGKKASFDGVNLIQEAKNQVEKLKRKTEIFNVFFRDKRFSEIVVNFNNLFPETAFVDVESITYTSRKITFNGRAENSSLISDVKSNMEDSAVFDSIDCKQRTSPSKKDGKQWKFRCTLNIRSSQEVKKSNKKEK